MKVFWFDTETSGLDPVKHGIISLAYQVEDDGGKIIDDGQLFSNPGDGKELDAKALAVNHFTVERVRSFPSRVELYRALLRVFERHVRKYDHADKFYAGGFNVDFDMQFLRQLWKEEGDAYFGSFFFFQYIDPSTVIPWLRWAGRLPDFPAKAKLLNTVLYFNLGSLSKAHDAWYDLDMTRAVSMHLRRLITGAIPWEEARVKRYQGIGAKPAGGVCPACMGSGKSLNDPDGCWACGGTGHITPDIAPSDQSAPKAGEGSF